MAQVVSISVEHAQQLGMEFTIAASPGWSESGGPWVKPEQAMKKLVWSEAVVDGGKRVSGRAAASARRDRPLPEYRARGGAFRD